MTELPTIVYLHGLGSSPQSTKARLVQGYFEERGFAVHIPSLALPSFERLSPDKVVSFVTETIRQHGGHQNTIVVGSSFGGFIAVHSFHRLSEPDRSRIRGLVLLAPVFYPWHPQYGLIPPEMERLWKEQGVFPLSEGEEGKVTPVRFSFVEELRSYESDRVMLTVPTLIIHGKRDDTVSCEQSIEFGAKQPNVQVLLVDDNHQLTADAQGLLSTIRAFIESGCFT